jgi:hypothetical protein
MTSDGESVPMVTTLGNTVVLQYTSSTDDSDSKSIGNAPWKTEQKRANKNQKTFENVERLMVDRKEYLTNILRKKGAKMESLKNASATKHPCNLKHCDEQMYCIDEEIQNIDKILAGFESIRKGEKRKDTPLIFLMSTYLSQRINTMEQQYDRDVDEVDTYKELLRQIDDAIDQDTKHVQELNIPYILIDSTHHHHDSIFFRIYDYLTYTAQIIKNNIQLYYGKINYFRLQYPNEADNINVLLKWTKPINEWEEEVEKIHKFRKHFKNILKNTDQPTVGDLLGDKYKIPIEFFSDLHEYLSLKQKQLTQVPISTGNSPLTLRENAVRELKIQTINNFEQVADKWNKDAQRKFIDMFGNLTYDTNRPAKRTKLT